MFGNVNYHIYFLKKLIEAGRVSIIEYCSKIWGYKDIGCINSLQNREMTSVLSVNGFVQTHALYGDLAWCIPRNRRWVNMLSLWNRFALMPDDRLHKNISCRLGPYCTDNWCMYIKEILESLSLNIILFHGMLP